MEELSHFSQVIYAYSDCSERFQMDPRLDEEARTCAVITRSYGLIPFSLASFWDGQAVYAWEWKAVDEA